MQLYTPHRSELDSGSKLDRHFAPDMTFKGHIREGEDMLRLDQVSSVTLALRALLFLRSLPHREGEDILRLDQVGSVMFASDCLPLPLLPNTHPLLLSSFFTFSGPRHPDVAGAEHCPQYFRRRRLKATYLHLPLHPNSHPFIPFFVPYTFTGPRHPDVAGSEHVE
jgi:hypothetical protein